MPDAHFELPRLAAVYDALDPDRSDLDAYRALVVELGATYVVDVGCGTGTFACLLARGGLRVTGVDPAGASLDVARAKPDAGHVTWVHGDLGALPPLGADLAIMTGNVAQVFVDDEQWSSTLHGCRRVLRPGGHLVFETRVPEDRAWLRWTREATSARVVLADGDALQYWAEVTDVRPGAVSFVSTYRFESDGATYESTSTLRFRTRRELSSSLDAAGFEVEDVREAPDRPGREMVFVARRRG